MQQVLRCADRLLDLTRPHVMGILNVTPDSFSDGGRFVSPAAAVQQARSMCEQGASIIDIGGESTRPGATPVSEQEELDRVIPVVEGLARELDVILSIDTSSPVVMKEGAAAGAGFINDVRALSRPGALEAAKNAGLPVCLMHMRGEPASMQNAPSYADIIAEVSNFLRQRIDACVDAGIPRHQLVLDPGFGFGKTLRHNLVLLQQLERLQSLELPLLVGMSRKSMIGAVLEKPVEQRLSGSLALAVMAVQRGARILRVHDVGPTVDAIRMAVAVMQVSLEQEAGIP